MRCMFTALILHLRNMFHIRVPRTSGMKLILGSLWQNIFHLNFLVLKCLFSRKYFCLETTTVTSFGVLRTESRKGFFFRSGGRVSDVKADISTVHLYLFSLFFLGADIQVCCTFQKILDLYVRDQNICRFLQNPDNSVDYVTSHIAT